MHVTFKKQYRNYYELLYNLGLCPFKDMRCENWDLGDDKSVELFASFEIPTNILVKFDKTPE